MRAEGGPRRAPAVEFTKRELSGEGGAKTGPEP